MPFAFKKSRCQQIHFEYSQTVNIGKTLEHRFFLILKDRIFERSGQLQNRSSKSAADVHSELQLVSGK